MQLLLHSTTYFFQFRITLYLYYCTVEVRIQVRSAKYFQGFNISIGLENRGPQFISNVSVSSSGRHSPLDLPFPCGSFCIHRLLFSYLVGQYTCITGSQAGYTNQGYAGQTRSDCHELPTSHILSYGIPRRRSTFPFAPKILGFFCCWDIVFTKPVEIIIQ